MVGFVLSAEAADDLEHIYIYGEENWGERQADLYLRGLYEVFERLAAYPRLGRARPELGKDVRSFPHVSHVVFFTPLFHEVAILRVLHGARDIDEIVSQP